MTVERIRAAIHIAGKGYHGQSLCGTASAASVVSILLPYGDDDHCLDTMRHLLVSA